MMNYFILSYFIFLKRKEFKNTESQKFNEKFVIFMLIFIRIQSLCKEVNFPIIFDFYFDTFFLKHSKSILLKFIRIGIRFTLIPKMISLYFTFLYF